MSSTWQSGTAYGLGAYVEPTVANGKKYECTTAGTSGGSEPTWTTTIGNTTADNTATWTCRAAADFEKPGLSSKYAGYLDDIKDLVKAASRMFQTDKTVANYPDGCIRWNDSTKKFEKYSAGGGTWSALDLSGQDVGYFGGQLPAYYRDADTVDTFHASQTPAANQVVVMDSNGNMKRGTAIVISETDTNYMHFNRGGAESVLGGSGSGRLAANCERVSGAWKYIGTGAAYLLQVTTSGGLAFQSAASGSAGGTVSFTAYYIPIANDSLRVKKLDIGAWNMDANDGATKAHGLSVANIVDIQVMIRNDADTQHIPLKYINYSTGAGDGTFYADATNIYMYRRTGGTFDDANHDDAVLNRGYILITYVA